MFLIPILAFSGHHRYAAEIYWNQSKTIESIQGGTQLMLSFSGAQYFPERDFLPLWSETFALDRDETAVDVRISNKIFETFLPGQLQGVKGLETIEGEIRHEFKVGYGAGRPYVTVSLVPVRKNEITGLFEKLVSFEIVVTTSPHAQSTHKSASLYNTTSALADGNWFKLAVQHDGVYKIAHSDLQDMGIDIAAIDPRHIRIYGNGGGMVPESTGQPRHDDIVENAIFVTGEEDGVFNQGDYILFYGQSPNQMDFAELSGGIKQITHLYSDYTYYFLTTDKGPGKRIQNMASTTQPPGITVNSYNDFIVHEEDLVNLIKSGRVWYGETFDQSVNMEKEYDIPGLILSEPVLLDADVAARSFSTSSFTFFVNDSEVLNIPIPAVSNTPNTYWAKSKNLSAQFSATSSTLSVRTTYNKPSSESVGFLNYYILSFRRGLNFRGGQMAFRDLLSAGAGVTARFILGNAGNNVVVWNVTDPTGVKKIDAVLSGSELTFTVGVDSLMEFIAFDGTSFYSAVFAGKVENQNLHGMEQVEMVIVTPEIFRSQAERLAQHHRDHDEMTVAVVDLPDIYNEFSSGAQDIAAIRDFLKMLYDRSGSGQELKYLLLFGDGSYDHKNRVQNNTNFVPTWQSPESLHTVSSYVTDDFFGFLDDSGDSMLDIGIGRLVVASEKEAGNVVDKIIHYSTGMPEVMGNWRNVISLIADDEDSNLHLEDAEELASVISALNEGINVEKIYLDAYKQASTPGGERYPEANADINRRVARGALLINYVGHGGETGWAHESILQISDITSWDNMDNMPVFVTATCEFSRFDDPGRISGGEYVLLNPKGGGIALFTTTRATYAGSNSALNQRFYEYAITRTEDGYLRMGDIMRLSKMDAGSNENGRKFILMGDPALKIAFPEYFIQATHINNQPISAASDTIKALSEVTISGRIVDAEGNLYSDYQGVLFPTVFDKPTSISTLGNDPGSYTRSFLIQNNILYKGKASITNGQWSFTFIAPKDLAYQYDFGKISLYADNGITDAAGFNHDVIMGGYNENALPDLAGPSIDLFINDTNFVSGGITDENPVLLAFVEDESGINTSGSGIGHDLTAVLDNADGFVVNDYYEAEIDDFRRGTIEFPFFSLREGSHTLNLKVWDVHNNSSEAQIGFIVASSGEMALENLLNYPNPFSNSTVFSFEHNQPDDELDVAVRIYSMSGQLVRTIEDIYYSGGYKYKSVAWDGTDEYGNKLKQGMYIFRVTVQNPQGGSREATSKLVLIR